jgi:hypothetical protein
MYESIIKILNRVKDQIIQEYNQKGIRASGKFERNITVGRQGRYKVVLTLPSYSQYIMKFKSNKGGRGPGSQPPPRILEQWVKDKGLKLRDFITGRFVANTETNYKKAAYLIGRKIARQGTDIHKGKRQPIDLDRIVDNQFDYLGNELADRIFQEIKL